jgi:hypothetical protein
VRPWLFRLGREQGWLEGQHIPLKSGRDHRDGPGAGWVPRHKLPPKLIDRLKPMPESLEQEIQAYLQWCRRVVQPGRPHAVKKRATSCKMVYEALARMAGFAVRFQHLPAELLTLRDLCDPALVHIFIQWWGGERRRKLTPGLCNMVVNLEVTARHYLKELPYAKALKELPKGDLAVAEAVRDKRTRWLSLAQIDAVGHTITHSTPHASTTFERPGPSNATSRTRRATRCPPRPVR